MELQNRVRELRKAKGLTQANLAARAGLTQGTVSQLEAGKLSLNLKWMRALAGVLECSPAELLAAGDNPDRLSADEHRFIRLLRQVGPEQRELIARLVIPLDYPDATPED